MTEFRNSANFYSSRLRCPLRQKLPATWARSAAAFNFLFSGPLFLPRVAIFSDFRMSAIFYFALFRVAGNAKNCRPVWVGSPATLPFFRAPNPSSPFFWKSVIPPLLIQRVDCGADNTKVCRRVGAEAPSVIQFSFSGPSSLPRTTILFEFRNPGSPAFLIFTPSARPISPQKKPGTLG